MESLWSSTVFTWSTMFYKTNHVVWALWCHIATTPIRFCHKKPIQHSLISHHTAWYHRRNGSLMRRLNKWGYFRLHHRLAGNHIIETSEVGHLLVSFILYHVFSLLLLFYVNFIPHFDYSSSWNFANRQQKLYKWTDVENIYVQIEINCSKQFLLATLLLFSYYSGRRHRVKVSALFFYLCHI